MPAAESHVFHAWTDGGELQRWFAAHVVIDPRLGIAYEEELVDDLCVGGRFEMDMRYEVKGKSVVGGWRWFLEQLKKEVEGER